MPHPFLLGELDFWELVKTSEPLPLAVLAFLAAASVFSWTIIFAKLTGFRKARSANQAFLKMFRKSPRMLVNSRMLRWRECSRSGLAK